MRQLKIDWVYLQAALALVALVYLASLWLFPLWNQLLGLVVVLALAAAAGVFTFVVSLRQNLHRLQALGDPSLRARSRKTSGRRVNGSLFQPAVEDEADRDRAGPDPASRDQAAADRAAAPASGASTLPGTKPGTLIHPTGTVGPRRLPDPPADFGGRDQELRQLTTWVRQGSVALAQLCGPRGVGKTSLALALANSLAMDYPDAQVLIDLQGTTRPLSPTAAMALVVHTFNPTAALPDDAVQLEALYRTTLLGQRALLLLDNAFNGEQVSRLVPPKGCLMLVTAPEPMVIPSLYVLTVDSLPIEFAAALLLRLAPRVGQRAAELAELCGRMPIALRLAGGALAERPDISLSDYAGWLRAAQARLSQPDPVKAALTVNFDLLTVERQRRWCRLAVFPASFDRPAAVAVLSEDTTTDDVATQRLNELLRYGLVAAEPMDGAQRYRLHDPVRLVAAQRLDDQARDEAQQRHAAHYCAALAAANANCKKGGPDALRGLRLFDVEQFNILAGQSWAAVRTPQIEAAARLAVDYPTAGNYVLGLRLPPRALLAWLDTALSAARQLGYPAAEASLLLRLGRGYLDLGEPNKAISFYEQYMQIGREFRDRRGDGDALGNLGLAYDELGNSWRAVAYYVLHIEIAREIGDRWGEARTSWNLGLAYEALGYLPDAIAAMQVCVDFQREIGHPNAAVDAAEVERLRARLAAQAH